MPETCARRFPRLGLPREQVSAPVAIDNPAAMNLDAAASRQQIDGYQLGERKLERRNRAAVLEKSVIHDDCAVREGRVESGELIRRRAGRRRDEAEDEVIVAVAKQAPSGA